MKRKSLLAAVVVAFAAVALRAAAGGAEAESLTDSDVFTKVNMRYDAGRKTGSFIQYRSLTLLPAGSPVHLNAVNLKGFTMTLPDVGEIRVDYRPEWGGGKPVEDILPALFSRSQKPVLSAIAKLSKTDQKGIKEGKALEGMTRDGVITALGPLALHKTASRDADIWTYWSNRFVFYHVTFKGDKVVEVGAAGR